MALTTVKNKAVRIIFCFKTFFLSNLTLFNKIFIFVVLLLSILGPSSEIVSDLDIFRFWLIFFLSYPDHFYQ
mgnify:CR=1 FL=1